jgi:hypothetical protein
VADAARVRLSPSDRLTLAFFGIVVGSAAAWFAWRLVSRGELLVGLGVSGLAGVGVLALLVGRVGPVVVAQWEAVRVALTAFARAALEAGLRKGVAWA